MATATCQTVSGAISYAYPFKLRTSSGMTKAGAEMASGSVTWAGSDAKRKAANWLPSPNTPLIMDDGRTISPVWYRAMHELFEHRMGGIDAPTIPQVATTSQQTQSQVLLVQINTSATIQAVNACADSVNTTRAVSIDASLPGADQIPVVQRVNPKLIDF